jgi:HD-like signal output (HDOD) protein
MRAVAMGALAIALAAGWSSIALFYTAAFVSNSGEVVFQSASQTMVASIVSRDRLEWANGWLADGTIATQRMISGRQVS